MRHKPPQAEQEATERAEILFQVGTGLDGTFRCVQQAIWREAMCCEAQVGDWVVAPDTPAASV